jgi:hypothetical protein
MFPGYSKLSFSIFAAPVSMYYHSYALRLVSRLRSMQTWTDIQVDISDFVRHLCSNQILPGSSLDVTTICGTNAHCRTEHTSVKLITIEQRLFLLLFDLIAHLTTENVTGDVDLPGIWINGQGRPPEARYSGVGSQSVVVHNRYQGLNAENILSQGDGKCETMCNKTGTQKYLNHRCFLPSKASTISTGSIGDRGLHRPLLE